MMHQRRSDNDGQQRAHKRQTTEDWAGPASEPAQTAEPVQDQEFLTTDDLERIERCAPEVLETLTNLADIASAARSDPTWDGADCLAVVKGLEAITRALEYAQTQAIARLDRDIDPAVYGAAKITSLLRSRLKISLREARRRDTAAHNLAPQTTMTGSEIPTRFPNFASGLAAGTFSVDQVQAATDEIETLPAAIREVYEPQVEETLADAIAPLEVADIKALGARIRGHLDPDGKFDRQPYRPDELHVTIKQLRDGSWKLTGKVDAATGLLMSNLLTNREKSPKEIADRIDALGENSDSTHATNSATTDIGSGTTPEADSGPGTDACADASAETADPTSCPGQGELWDDEGRSSSATNLSGTEPVIPHSNQPIGPHGSQSLDPDRGESIDPDHSWKESVDADPRWIDSTSADPNKDPDGTDAFGIPNSANAIGADGTPTRVISPDHRTDGQRRHDRFALLVRRAAQSAPAGAAYALIVTATAEEYARGKGEVQAAGGHINLHELENLSPGGMFYYQSTRPGSKKMEVRSHGRFATRRQLELITARDRGCTFPGCDMPPGWCEAHHMIPHRDGGPTDINNLTLACSFHHHWHETQGWRAEMIDGLPAWIPPSYAGTDQTPQFHSRFLAQRAAITGINTESPGYNRIVSENVAPF